MEESETGPKLVVADEIFVFGQNLGHSRRPEFGEIFVVLGNKHFGYLLDVGCHTQMAPCSAVDHV